VRHRLIAWALVLVVGAVGAAESGAGTTRVEAAPAAVLYFPIGPWVPSAPGPAGGSTASPGDEVPPWAGPATLASGSRPATIAKIMTPTAVRSSPGGTIRSRLATFMPSGGGPMDLLVLGHRTVGGRPWVRVLLPTRPNGSSGWVDADTVRLSTTPWRILVSVADRAVSVYRSGRRVRSFRAVVGTSSTPTPRGQAAIAERFPLGSHGGFYGTWIITLTAHSRVLRTFEGGDGRVALHGRGGRSLRDPLGSARSHGCIRMDNSAMNWLATVARPGTPVVVV